MKFSKIFGYIWAALIIVSIPAVYGMALLSLMAFDSPKPIPGAFFFVGAHWLYGPIAIVSLLLFWKRRNDSRGSLPYLLIPLYYPIMWLALSWNQPNYTNEKCASVKSNPLCSKQVDGTYICKDSNPNFASETIRGCK